ncbi:hypothetical protein [Paenibacillus larvae]|uniref:hypothetical protein n=1 Tax=Paenibacillus larvae TaxID=1464 RepID=UPI0018DE6AFC|nr:hypothetical protein [Paenibacillus larvae]
MIVNLKGVTFGKPRQPIDETFIRAYEEWKAGRMTATAKLSFCSIQSQNRYASSHDEKANEFIADQIDFVRYKK